MPAASRDRNSPVSSILAGLLDQATRPFAPAARAVGLRRWRLLWLGVAGAAAVTACAVVDRMFHPAMLAYTAGTPWSQAVVRIPVSVVAPALDLPYWGAVAQVLIVFACAQPLLGWRQTLAIGLTAHVLATVAMRALLTVAGNDLPSHWRTELDSGPSVAVLSVAIAATIMIGSKPVTGLLVTFVVVELLVLHEMAGIEHAVGIVVGGAVGFSWRRPPRLVRHPSGSIRTDQLPHPREPARLGSSPRELGTADLIDRGGPPVRVIEHV